MMRFRRGAGETHGATRALVPRQSVLLVVCLVFFASAASTTSAWAHGAGETTEGYVLVQQALGHLAHDSGHAGVEAAMEKIHDALSTTDQSGVDVAEVKRAETALTADHIEQARSLLQHSILVATGSLGPAVGEQTGTTVVLLPMAGRGALDAAQWVLGFVSLLMILAGVAVAFRFRPQDNLTQLRRRLSTNEPVRSHASSRGHKP